MHRLFVALRPPIAMRRALIAAMGGICNARWQDDDQLHITLRYIGKVERPVAEDIAITLESIQAEALTLAASGVGSFDIRGRVDTVWAGVTPHEAIARLHRKIDQALIRLGLPPEGRSYLPHITLARLPKAAGPAERFMIDQAGLTTAPAVFEHFLLYESHLGHGGAQYEPIARYPLVG